MAVSPARATAFDILLRVEREQAYASELLHSSQYQKLSAQDHGLATELVMGVLRWRSLLDQQIGEASTLPLRKLDLEVLSALRLAAYQLLFLDRVPASAAVNESVDLVKRSRKRSAMPFANAVLRKLSVSLPALKDGLRTTATSETWGHPQWLVERWNSEYGDAIARTICDYDQKNPEASVRFTCAEVEEELHRDGIRFSPGAILTSARRVISGELTKTAAFREGRVIIQDEASQLVALMVGKGSHILDCCAAPGGKTRILAERNPGAQITAIDLHPHRARLLRKLVPAGNVDVIAADVRRLPTSKLFDRILVDAPCSGTGTLARNPEVKWRLKLDDIADLQARQTAILQSAMRVVAPGGRLIYSTCSLEREENAEVIEKALLSDALFRVVNCSQVLAELHSDGELRVEAGSLVNGKYLRTLPGISSCDGFFAAILERT